MLQKIMALFRKELLTLVKDPANRTLLIMPALIQALLFGYGATYDLTHVPYAVLDQSRGAASTELLARLDGTGVFERIATLTTPNQIAEVVDPGHALLVISIPSDFEERLASGQQAPLQVILDGRNSSTAGSASAYISSIVSSFNQSLGSASPVEIVRRVWFNPNLESRWNIMPALIASLSMLQTLMLAALSVAREREQGTFDQLLVTPMTPMQILIGKALPSIFVGLLQSHGDLSDYPVLVQDSHERLGRPALFGLFVFTAASVGIGLSISAIALNMQQAMLYTFMLLMPLMLLSGLLTPVRNMPEILQIITYANPLRFGIDLVRRVYLEGAGLSDIAFNFVPMLITAAITLPLAAWLFRNRLS
jgi:ABC-2 type transport system permease protein